MGEAIGQMLPAAVGVAISPFPIVAVVLMLVTPRGRVNAPAFLIGWLAGLAVVGTIVLVFSDGAGANDDGAPATWVSWLDLVIGLALLFLAVKMFRGRPTGDEQAATPKWMSQLDGFTPVKALGMGALLAGLNPKNLLLTVSGASAIAQTGISGGEQAVAYVVFMVIASIGVGVPVVLYFVLGDRSRAPLDALKTWMATNNAAIMAVMLVVFGAKAIGQAITGFSA